MIADQGLPNPADSAVDILTRQTIIDMTARIKDLEGELSQVKEDLTLERI